MCDKFLSIPWALNMLVLKYTRVVNIRRLHMVLCKLHFKDSQYPMSRVLIMLKFWMYQEFKYAILNSFEKNTSSYIFESEYIRVLIMSGFIKKALHHIDTWQSSYCSSVSAYNSVLNMPMLHKVLKKILHHRCLTGFQIFLRFWTFHGSKYARVTQGSEQQRSIIDIW